MSEELRSRTTELALRVVRLYAALPKSIEAQVIGKQLLRSGTSVGAHYREAHFAKSDLDLISKIEGALQELEESSYWLEILERAGIVSAPKLASLRAETAELKGIFITIVLKVKDRLRSKKLDQRQ